MIFYLNVTIYFVHFALLLCLLAVRNSAILTAWHLPRCKKDIHNNLIVYCINVILFRTVADDKNRWKALEKS